MKLLRADGVLDFEVVSSKKLVFFGVGSLGSMAISNLAYPWREMVLVDPEILGPENVERHVLGRSWLGRPKVLGMADWLVDRGIDASSIRSVVGNAQDVFDRNLDADLAVVCVDDPPTKAAINSWCVQYDIPALYGSVYGKGSGGEVISIPKPRGICYICAAHQLKEDAYQGKVVNYGLGSMEQQSPLEKPKAIPALKWAINEVSCDVADFALEILVEGGGDAQVDIEAHRWEDILVFGGNVPEFIAKWLVGMSRIGLIPNMKLVSTPSGYSLSMRRSEVAIRLKRWDRCPCHSQTLQADF